jgi:hypothetical protein
MQVCYSFFFKKFFHFSIQLGVACSWEFLKYTPSSWETYWFSNIETLQYEVCRTLTYADQISTTIDVLRRIIQLQNDTFTLSSQKLSVDIHFSRMHYRRTCGNEYQEATQLIEPLIGLIRDPLTMCPRHSSIPSDLYLDGDNAVQSKRFLLLAPSSPFQIDPSIYNMNPLPPWFRKHGSQKILIDMGSSYFSSRHGNTVESSTRWFYEYFKKRSIQFDRIIAFEYEQLAPRRVWEDIFPFYTFINVGVEANSSNFNPWKMLEAIAKPSDYVVVKVDIDTPPIESALMKQLFGEHKKARSLIDEMFFEMHVSYDRALTEDKLKDSYVLFTKLRQHGVRMHGWP